MTNTPENLATPTDNPEVEIRGIFDVIMAMGANDFERFALEDILNNLRTGNIAGEEAVRRAREVLASKQDYH